jgi:hypothetical protein
MKQNTGNFTALLLTIVIAAASGSSSAAPSWTATWTQKAAQNGGPGSPGQRGWFRMDYDTLNGKAIFFGGSAGNYDNDMWSYDSSLDHWTLLSPWVGCDNITGFTPPTIRDEVVTAYDQVNQLYWIFGGTGYGCSGATRTTQTGTSADVIVDSTLTATAVDAYKGWTAQGLYGHLSFVTSYDPAAKKLALATPIGYLTGAQTYRLFPQRGGGTFFFNPVTQTWTNRTGPLSGYTGPDPIGRLSPAFAYSTLHKAILMYGGSETANDTWAIDVTTKSWVKLNTSAPTSPPSLLQLQSSMVYDEANDVFILFGGRCGDINPLRCAYYKQTNQTWAYKMSTNTWTQMNPPVSPPPREQPQMAYDPVNQAVVMFGGTAAGPVVYNDTWVYDYRSNTWSPVSQLSPPAGRYLGGITYDRNNSLFVMYGGVLAGQHSSGEVWHLRLSGGANLAPNPVAGITPASSGVGTVFTFNASGSTDPGGSINSYLWNFGDGATSNLASTTHSYSAAGTYTITLTVTDNQGLSRSVSTTRTVTGAAGAGPVISLTNVVISGAVSDLTVTQVLVNGKAIPVSGGKFQFPIPLPVGLTQTTIQATGAGGTTSKIISITVP